MRPIFVAVFVVGGLAAADAPGQAELDEPCVELRLHGKGVVQIPCPGGLDRTFELPLFRQAPERKDDFAIVPGIPDDRDMVIDPEWPHDPDIIAEPEGL